MGRWRTEHYYTCKGRRRAVFLRGDGGTAKFVLEVNDGDEAFVEVTYDPPAVVEKGQGVWERFSADCGGLYGVTALRVNVVSLTSWVKLTVEQENENG